MLKKIFLFLGMLGCIYSGLAQHFVPMKIVSGFNADVIANGVGSVLNSTTHRFDNADFNLVSRDFKSTVQSPALDYGLPVDGRIIANYDPSVIFQLNPYSESNSLRLIGSGSTGELVFETPENATRILLLTTAGNAVGLQSKFSVEIRFTDNTIQSFNDLYAQDWYYLGLSSLVISGIGRVRSWDDVLEKSTDYPRLYATDIELSVSNYYKKIKSIQVVKTSSTTEALNIMAVTVKKTLDCFEPTNIEVSHISTNQAMISWSAGTISPSLGYEYEIRTSGLPESGLTGLVASGAVASNTLLKDISNLLPSTYYYVYVRSKCTATSFSEWSLPKRFEISCLPPTVTVAGNSICLPGTVDLTAKTTDGVLQWYDSSTSRTVLQTGENFTTPFLNATKSYWVDATSSDFVSMESGKKTLSVGANDVNTFVNWGIVFDLTHDVFLKSTDVFVGASGTLDVAIYDAAGAELFSTGNLTISALGIANPVTIPLNVQLKPGKGYKMLIKSFKDITLYRDYVVPFPYKDISETLIVHGGFFDGYTRDYYYYYYNLVFEKICKSPRQKVIATITHATAPTTDAPIQTFCFDAGTQLKDLRIDGSNIKWYNAATGGNPWSETALVTDGRTYYASQTINGCESEARLAVTTKLEKINVFSVNQNIAYNYRDIPEALAATAAPGNKILWYLTAAAVDGDEIAPIPSTDAVGVQRYWLREISALGCMSDAVEISVIVNPVELTVTADAALSKVFGTSDPIFTYKATGFVGADEKTLFTGALDRVGGEDIGSYAITKGSLSAGPNYTIRFISGDFAIEKAPISGISFNNQTFTYDGNVKSVAIDGTLPKGVTVLYENNDQTDAGTYKVTAHITGTAIYKDATQTAVLTIEKATQQIIFNAPDMVLKSLGNLNLDVHTSSGLPVELSVNEERFASLSGTNLQLHALGTVLVTAKQAGDTNYEAALPIQKSIRITLVASERLPVIVHQALSPNGDGINEFLRIEGIEDYPENKVTIFDKLGRVLRAIQSYNNQDKVFTGEYWPDGTYYYYLDLKDGQEWKRAKGFFVIKRN